MFARFGIPEQLVSDNGPQFVSEEFKKFMTTNGIKHIKCAPYHPSSNGAAERMVQTLKLALKADHKSGVPLEHSLANFLLHYRITPHSTTGVAPCILMMNHRLRTRLDLLKPDVASNVYNKQAYQKQYSDHNRQTREFTVDQKVMIHNFRDGDKWVSGKIVDQLGPVSYLIQCNSGELWRRHVDHIHDIIVSQELPPEPEQPNESILPDQNNVDPTDDTSSFSDMPVVTTDDVQAEPSHSPSEISGTETETADTTDTETVPAAVSTPRYPKRSVQPPDRYM